MPLHGLQDTSIHCPHCAHHIHVDIEQTDENQRYQEECAACGGDILIECYRDPADDRWHLRVSADDEQYY